MVTNHSERNNPSRGDAGLTFEAEKLAKHAGSMDPRLARRAARNTEAEPTGAPDPSAETPWRCPSCKRPRWERHITGIEFPRDGKVNQVFLLGKITGDVQIRRTKTGRLVARFSLVTEDSYKDQAGDWKISTETHQIQVWGKLAQIVGKEIREGAAAYVGGRLTTREWTSKEQGKRTSTEVVATNIRFVEASDTVTPKRTGDLFEKVGNLIPHSPGPTRNTAQNAVVC